MSSSLASTTSQVEFEHLSWKKTEFQMIQVDFTNYGPVFMKDSTHSVLIPAERTLKCH